MGKARYVELSEGCQAEAVGDVLLQDEAGGAGVQDHVSHALAVDHRLHQDVPTRGPPRLAAYTHSSREDFPPNLDKVLVFDDEVRGLEWSQDHENLGHV